MARPREFDIESALSKAVNVFWERGYSDSTLPDLLDGMNLTRGSLYKAFTDKKTLFLQVLGRYDEQEVAATIETLHANDEEGWARIFKVFDSIEAAVRSGDERGCLLCSAIAGPAAYDQDIATEAAKSLDRMLTAFEHALNTAVPAPMVRPLAHMLITQYIGMRIMARTPSSIDQISQSIASLKSIAAQTPSG